MNRKSSRSHTIFQIKIESGAVSKKGNLFVILPFVSFKSLESKIEFSWLGRLRKASHRSRDW